MGFLLLFFIISVINCSTTLIDKDPYPLEKLDVIPSLLLIRTMEPALPGSSRTLYHILAKTCPDSVEKVNF